MEMATVLILGREYATAAHELERARRAAQRAKAAFDRADKAAGTALRTLNQAISAHLDEADAAL